MITGCQDFVLSVSRARRYTAQLVDALRYMHEDCFAPDILVHRDIKPENVLIDACFSRIMLADFGFAKRLHTGEFCYSFVGTPEYLAPEVTIGRGLAKDSKRADPNSYRYRYDKAVDWWGVGVFVYEILAGCERARRRTQRDRAEESGIAPTTLRRRTPFYSSEGLGETFRKIEDCAFTFPSGFDKGARNLITALLTHDPLMRLGNLPGGASDIQNHEWFEGVCWHSLSAQRT